MKNETAEININKTSSFIEIYYEGFIKYEEKEYKFWLIWPRGQDDEGKDYEICIKWWFAKVPSQIRSMESTIIESFKQLHEI